MDPLLREIELRTQNFCRWVLEPGWQEYVKTTADRLAELRPDLYADMKARVDAAYASSFPSEPSTPSTTASTGSSAPAESVTNACTPPSRSTATSVRRSRAS